MGSMHLEPFKGGAEKRYAQLSAILARCPGAVLLLGDTNMRQVRAAPLVRGKVNFTVKNAVCESPQLLTSYGVFTVNFDFDFQEWSCDIDWLARGMGHGRRVRQDM